MGQGKGILRLAAAGLLLFLGAKYVFALALPFLIGWALALLARPGTVFLKSKLRLPPAVAGGISVALVVLLLLALAVTLGAYALKQAAVLSTLAPDVQKSLARGAEQAQSYVTGLVSHAPDGLQPLLTQVCRGVFQSGQRLTDTALTRLPGLLAGLISRVSQGALTVFTGVLAGVMLSGRTLSWQRLVKRLPEKWQNSYLPALSSAKQALKGWLKAQLKLMGITWLIVSTGLTVAGIAYGVFWAVPVTLVDAVPMLGTGTVLIPWAALLLLQGSGRQGAILLGTFAAAMLTRTVLEPRLVGRQIGLDPLVTLVALYVGFRLWGIAGMLLCPLLAAAGKTFLENLPVQK